MVEVRIGVVCQRDRALGSLAVQLLGSESLRDAAVEEGSLRRAGHQAAIKEFGDAEVAVHTPTSKLNVQDHCLHVVANRRDCSRRHQTPVVGTHIGDSSGSGAQGLPHDADAHGRLSGVLLIPPVRVRAQSIRT